MELAALRSMPDASLEVPPEEELEVLNQYLSAGETFIEVEEQRKAALAAQVGGSLGWSGACWACMQRGQRRVHFSTRVGDVAGLVLCVAALVKLLRLCCGTRQASRM